MATEEFIQQLLAAEDTETSQKAWSQFLFNVPLARDFVAQVSKETATLVLNQGHKFNGWGWNTSRASKVVYDLTAIPLVTSSVGEYRDSFLFAIAMAKEVEVIGLELGDRASEVAYALCSLLVNDPVQDVPPVPYSGFAEGTAHREEADPAEVTGLDWDEVTEDLPPELTFIWREVAAGKRKLDLRSLLEVLPRFGQLPVKAPENNFREDAKKGADRTAKAWQQCLLHMARIHCCLYMGLAADIDKEELLKLGQQEFQYLAEIYQKISIWRKECSVPGCVAQSNDAEMLFEKDDVQLQNQAFKVNSMGKQSKGIGRFRVFSPKIITIPSGFPGFRGRAKGYVPYGRGFGRGQGVPNVHSQGGNVVNFSGFGNRFQNRQGQGVPKNSGQGAHTLFQTGNWFRGYSKGGSGRGKGRGLPQPRIGDTSTISQVETENAMVEGSGSPTSGDDIDHKGPAMARAMLPQSDFNQIQGASGGGGCREGIAGLPKGGSCAEVTNPSRPAYQSVLFPKPNRFFGAMVCNLQARGRQNKNKAYFRLQTFECFSANKTFQNGPLGSHFPLFKNRNVGLQVGPSKCIFPFGIRQNFSEESKFVGRGKCLQVLSSPIWAKYPTIPVDPGYEGSTEAMETKRDYMFCVSRRHINCQHVQKVSTERNEMGAANNRPIRTFDQLFQKCARTNTDYRSFGVSDQFFQRNVTGAPWKTQISEKRPGKNCEIPEHVPQKNGSNFGTSQIIFDSSPCPQSIYRQNVSFYQEESIHGLGHRTSSTWGHERGTERIKSVFVELARKKIFGQIPQQDITFRQFRFLLGRNRSEHRVPSTGVLEAQKVLAHKCKGISSSCRHNQKFSIPRGACGNGGGQHGGILLLTKGWGEDTPPQQIDEKLLALVPQKEHNNPDRIAPFCLRSSRLSNKDSRQRRLYSKWGIVQSAAKQVQKLPSARMGHFCLSGQQKISQLHHQIPSLASIKSRCLNLSPDRHFPMLCQSPLENNPQVVAEVKGKSPHPLLVNSTLLGFHIMVAPFGKNAGAKDSCSSNSTLSGHVPKLFRGNMPPPKWPLLSVLLSGQFWREGKFHLKVSKLIYSP